MIAWNNKTNKKLWSGIAVMIMWWSGGAVNHLRVPWNSSARSFSSSTNTKSSPRVHTRNERSYDKRHTKVVERKMRKQIESSRWLHIGQIRTVIENDDAGKDKSGVVLYCSVQGTAISSSSSLVYLSHRDAKGSIVCHIDTPYWRTMTGQQQHLLKSNNEDKVRKWWSWGWWWWYQQQHDDKKHRDLEMYGIYNGASEPQTFCLLSEPQYKPHVVLCSIYK